MSGDDYVLELFVAGSTPRSTASIANIKRICEANLAGRYSLKVFDLYQQPNLAASHEIVAAPTLIKREPKPRRLLIGDLSDEAKVLSVLGLAPPPRRGILA